MGSEHPIKKFHPLSTILTKQTESIPFDKLPLYVNHEEQYVRYAVKCRLRGSVPLSFNLFLKNGGTRYQE